MACAFEDLFGIRDAFDGIPMAGRTDSWILTDALAAHDIHVDDPRIPRYRESYLRHLARELAAPAPHGKRHGVMPGVRELLDALADERGAYLALLTGNYERAAEMKLAHFDLWRYFPCGAFGDAAPDRNGLLPKAIERVSACGGRRFHPAEAIVIGDTPLDVGVAVAGGARSIGVATGSHSADELRAARADVVFDDLSDTAAVLAALNL
jgi:phosphoglycolate phosphatase